MTDRRNNGDRRPSSDTIDSAQRRLTRKEFLAASTIAGAGAVVAAGSGTALAGQPGHATKPSDVGPLVTGGAGGCVFEGATGFSPDGPWNTKLPASTPLADNSAALVASLQYDIVNYYGTFGINYYQYTATIYVADPVTPKQDWVFYDCQGKGSPGAAFAASLLGVPTLPGMVPALGTDEEIVIYDPINGDYWDFWHARVDADGQWSACWGGKISDYPNNPGIFDNGLGAVATGLPLGAFLIRIAELQQGLIPHAIGLSPIHTRAGVYSWPASRTDGASSGADYPVEGQRFRLDPAFDVSSLTNPASRTIAKAMQDYGLIVTDKSGALVTQAESATPYENRDGIASPYTELFGGPANQVIPTSLVDHFQALPLDYGKPA